MQAADLYSYYLRYPQVSTDTRDIKADSIFFALKGANFNGNAFAAEALAKGSRYAVIDEAAYRQDNRYLLVDDVLGALQALAKYHRERLDIPFIGITGSNGKTTTKELLHAVLAKKYHTYATRGNLNNHIGVPLTLLAITPDIEIAVIEMGANQPGEIAFLSDLSQPTHGLITNVGKAHLEGFGSFEGVMKTKGELYDHLANKQGFLFLQGDNPFLLEMAASRTIKQMMTYGFSDKNDVIGKLELANPLLQISWHKAGADEKHAVSTQLTGAYNMENLLAAIAVGLHFKVPADRINDGITQYKPANNRSQIRKTEYNTVICDYYNANASSMAAALENIGHIDATNKVVILGDMFELGKDTYEEHRKLVSKAIAADASRYIFVGKAFFEHQDGRYEFYETTAEAAKALQRAPIRDALVLLKASRGMAFEQLVDLL